MTKQSQEQPGDTRGDTLAPTVTGFIQAGGRSSRMGEDKAWLEIDGRPMIERVMSAARPLVENLTVIINQANSEAGRYQMLAERWGAVVVHDLHDYRGPLGGIHTSLSNCRPEQSALIIACDLPFVTTEFFSFLWRIHQDSRQDLGQRAVRELNRGPQAITLPVDREGRLQPLAGIYSASCLPAVERMLAEGTLRIDRICRTVETRRVVFEEFAHLSEAERLLVNINTLDEYRSLINIPVATSHSLY